MKKGYSKHMAHGDKQVMRNPYHDEQKSFRLLISFLRQLESVESPVTPNPPLARRYWALKQREKVSRRIEDESHRKCWDVYRQLSLWSFMINNLCFKQQKMFQQVRRVYKCWFVINHVWIYPDLAGWLFEDIKSIWIVWDVDCQRNVEQNLTIKPF